MDISRDAAVPQTCVLYFHQPARLFFQALSGLCKILLEFNLHSSSYKVSAPNSAKYFKQVNDCTDFNAQVKLRPYFINWLHQHFICLRSNSVCFRGATGICKWLMSVWGKAENCISPIYSWESMQKNPSFSMVSAQFFCSNAKILLQCCNSSVPGCSLWIYNIAHVIMYF